MRMVIQVAKAELRNLFYSPVAWFLLIAFLAQCAYLYSSVLYSYANWQDIMIKNNPEFKVWGKEEFTRILFLGGSGFFPAVLQNLYLFISLLTMGLIGRELQNGTIKLLYSSPIKLRHIVLGKYLAMMVYNLMLVMVIGIFFLSAFFQVSQLDYGMLLSAALGFYLLTCAYTAIGTFMSSISTYQVVTALGTFLVILGLTLVGGLWQKYDLVRDLTYFLFIGGRTEKMLMGLITSKDVIYFLLVVAMFLAFTILKLKAAREVKSWYVKMFRYAAVLAVVLALGYITSRPSTTLYWDTTAQKVNTIHEKTQSIIREMGDEPLEVTLYANFLGPAFNAGMPEARNAYLSGVWEKYVRFKPGIKFNYVYYYDHDSTILGNGLYMSFPGKSLDTIAAKMSEMYETDLDFWLKPAEIRKQMDPRVERLRLVMKLKYKDRTEYLRTYDDADLWPDELHFAAAFNKLVHPDYPEVAFLTGHYERNIYKSGEREFKQHTAGKDSRGALVNLGFDVDTLDLDNSDIPAGLDLLVLADPKTELSPLSKEKIRNYIDAGGNMMVYGEPGKQQMINPVLQQMGLKMMDGIMVQESKDDAQDLLQLKCNNALLNMIENPTDPYFSKSLGDADGFGMVGVGVFSITDSNKFRITPLFTPLKKQSWLKKGNFVRDSARIGFMPQEGDVKGDFHTGYALQRNIHHKDQRIIVTGDAGWMSNVRVRFPIGQPCYSWLTGGTYPIKIKRPPPPDRRLTITAGTADILSTIYVWILPGAILLFASILLIRRKRK